MRLSTWGKALKDVDTSGDLQDDGFHFLVRVDLFQPSPPATRSL
jgi:hypothetical protein